MSSDAEKVVVHLHDITWRSFSLSVGGAEADLYVSPFDETNVKGKKIGATDHRVMMEDLGFWKKFEKLKLRACDKEGKRREAFNVRGESELFYGFTRKNGVWYATSCTLNSWIKPK